MTPVPDVTGNSLTRARERLEEAGVSLAALHPVKPPADWKPAVAHNFEVEPYVVGVHPDAKGKTVVLDVVVAWRPGRRKKK